MKLLHRAGMPANLPLLQGATAKKKKKRRHQASKVEGETSDVKWGSSRNENWSFLSRQMLHPSLETECCVPASPETPSLQRAESVDRNGLIHVCVLHLFISASNINENKRICFPNEHKAIKYFRHTSLKIQSRELACIFKGPRFNNGELSSWQRPGSAVLRADCCTTSTSSCTARSLSAASTTAPRTCCWEGFARLRSLEKL